MKPITKKVIESGLVPKHALMLMQRWGYLDPEEAVIPDTGPAQRTAKELKSFLVRFVEELDELIEAEAEEEIKETSFSITLNSPLSIIWKPPIYFGSDLSPNIWSPPMVIFRDEFGHFIIPDPAWKPEIGHMFRPKTTDGDLHWYEITSCTPLWSGDTLIAYQIDAKELTNAPLPKL